MRPGQNKRMRGRNNNGGHRRGPNPLTRSYESNGPDVKIRGTAQHIGEKYLQLARDAQTSGDPVAAENYLQHAEHYFRIIAAAQQAQQQAQFGYQRAPGEADADEGDGEDDVVMPDRFALPSERFAQQNDRFASPNGTGPTSPNGTGQQPPYPTQPGYDRQDRGQPNDGYRADRDQRQDRDQRPDRDQRQDRDQRPERDQRQDFRTSNEFRQGGDRQAWDRQGGGDRGNGDRDRPYRNDRNQQRGPRYPREGGEFREQRNERDLQQPSYRDAPAPEARTRPDPTPDDAAQEGGTELPAFITAPARAPLAGSPPTEDRASDPTPAPTVDDAGPASSLAAGESAGEPESFPIKPRRRRRTRAVIDTEDAPTQPLQAEDGAE